MGFSWVIVLMGYGARKAGWFKEPGPEDDDEWAIQEELARIAAKKKPIWKRILHFITRKHAYRDMIAGISKRATETKIDQIIAWVPEKQEITEAPTFEDEGKK